MIRKAQLKDIDKIYELSSSLDTRFSQDHLKAMIAEDETYHILVLDDEINGYIILWESATNGQIIDLVVAPDKRHMGYGYKLVLEGLLYLEKCGVTYVSLEVKQTNKEAIRLYEKAQFIKERSIKNYYGHEDAYVYVRRLE